MTTAPPEPECPREVGQEPIPGYRLVERLGGGGYGEVWKCVAPGGLHKAVKFIRSADDTVCGPEAARQEFEAIEQVKAIRHPFVLGLERVEFRGPELLMVMELADKTLGDRLAECRADGRPGVPAQELFPLVVEAAEALDLLTSRRLQHLDVKPANLFLVGGHLKVGDFSLVAPADSERKAADGLGGITPKYVAPEVLQGRVSSASDQYSLALVIYELLTGQFPYPAGSARRAMLAHMTAAPDLSAVTPVEAAVFGRALAKKPLERFPTCREFVRRLVEARAGAHPADGPDANLTSTDFPSWGTRPDIKLPGQGDCPTADFEAVLPGYKVLDDLGPAVAGHSARVSAPDGSRYKARLVRGDGAAHRTRYDELARLLPTIAHPFLGQKVLAGPRGLVCFLEDDPAVTLGEYLRAHHHDRAGRAVDFALLDVLEGVAETLDQLAETHGLRHLALTPNRVVFQRTSPYITGFGLAELLIAAVGNTGSKPTPFTAPEVIANRDPDRADQYSLAVMCMAAVGLGLPATGVTTPVRCRLDAAGSLPRRAAAALRQALADRPAERFASAREFVGDLRDALPGAWVPGPLPPGLPPTRVFNEMGRTGRADQAPPAGEVVKELIRVKVLGVTDVAGAGPDAADLFCRFPVRAARSALLGKLKAFAARWNAEPVRHTGSEYVYHVAPPAGWFRRVLSAPAPIEFAITLPPSGDEPLARGEVTALARGCGSKGGKADPQRHALAVQMLQDLRTAAAEDQDSRQAVRYPVQMPVVLYPLDAAGEVGPAVEGKCVDLSAGGVRLETATDLRADHFYMRFLEHPTAPRCGLLGSVVRRSEVGPEHFEYGCRFAGG